MEMGQHLNCHCPEQGHNRGGEMVWCEGGVCEQCGIMTWAAMTT